MNNIAPTWRIALIGECMIELQQHSNGSLLQSYGGDTLNTAVYLAREMGGNATVDYVTALGDDSFSTAMCKSWQEEGIGLSMTQRFPGRLPGLYCIQTDEKGERRFLYWRNEAAVRNCFDEPTSAPILAALSGYDVLYFSGITLAVLGESGRKKLIAMLKEAQLKGALVAFDNNYRSRLWSSPEEARKAYRETLPYVGLALLTFEDEKELFHHRDIAAVFAACQEFGISEVVIKRGAESCVIKLKDQSFEVPAKKIDRIVDTTAAGDSFSAAYIACRLKGGDPALAALSGHSLASQVIQVPGALIPRERETQP
ncbi:ketodeoxygluconokinase [Pseudomonas fluorescens HK44]|uniref:2-dehydro-3-deoxygluconokinase n=1 Tax=Pseudomonas fluorescens HK44 TaxID=1042209 RepID=A0A010SRY2_PSEFL|nr:sugar kinase [Pseudomonas fluorescens]EXF93748.1 ketodeoxygluconokinase [Pseudomonas fluorescens HK44]